MKLLRVCLVSSTLCALAGTSLAGNVVGRLELPPPPDRPPVVAKGFLDRIENPLATVRPVAVAPQVVVALEGGAAPESPAQVTWDLVGESFSRPVIVVPIGAEVVIRNPSKTARMLVAAEDPKLIPSGPINPTGNKSFRPTEAKIYTIGDKDAPHLKGTIVVVNTKHVATVDAAGKFEIADVPEGSYKLRVFYQSGWIDRPDEAVTVPGKGKVDVSVKVPAGYPLKK